MGIVRAKTSYKKLKRGMLEGSFLTFCFKRPYGRDGIFETRLQA